MFVWNEKKKKGEMQPARFLSKMFLLLLFSQGFCILYFEFYALRVSLYRCMKGGRLSVCSRMAPSDLGSKVDFSERSMLISMFAVTLSGIFAIAHEGSCNLVSLFLERMLAILYYCCCHGDPRFLNIGYADQFGPPPWWAQTMTRNEDVDVWT